MLRAWKFDVDTCLQVHRGMLVTVQMWNMIFRLPHNV